jgi:hypothetical protein
MGDIPNAIHQQVLLDTKQGQVLIAQMPMPQMPNMQNSLHHAPNIPAHANLHSTRGFTKFQGE